jgi:putative endonuclease
MRNEKCYYVYIMTNKRNGTLYMGVTNSLFRRSNDHKEKRNKNSFTDKYNIKKLVYYEIFTGIKRAIAREKQLKNWKRKWKIELIEEDKVNSGGREGALGHNPAWRDLFCDMQ